MTTKLAKVTLCAECKLTNGWHDDGNGGTPYRCPNIAAAKNHRQAIKLAAEANEKAMAAAKLIFLDYARAVAEFSANEIRPLFDAADIPDPINGAVFSWAAGIKATDDGPIIENTGRRVQSDESSTRHEISVWRSRIHRVRGVA